MYEIVSSFVVNCRLPRIAIRWLAVTLALRFVEKKALKRSKRGKRVGRRGEAMPRNVRLLKNVVTGVDAIPSLNRLSWSIEVYGRKQAPFYPVHSRQRERWMDGAPRRRLRW